MLCFLVYFESPLWYVLLTLNWRCLLQKYHKKGTCNTCHLIGSTTGCTGVYAKNQVNYYWSDMTGHIGISKWLLCHQDTLGCFKKNTPIAKRNMVPHAVHTKLQHGWLFDRLVMFFLWAIIIGQSTTYIKMPYWEIPINSGMTIRITSLTAHVNHCPLWLFGLRNIWCRSVWRWSLLFVPRKNENRSEFGGAGPAKVLQGCPGILVVETSWNWRSLPQIGCMTQ